MKQDPSWYSKALHRQASRSAWNHNRNGWTPSSAHARSLYETARSTHHVLCMEWENKVASMHGLEMAFPFLDRDLISFLMAIPGEVLTPKGIPKGLLRAAMDGVLPEAIALRRGKADFTHLVNEAVERDFPRMVHCLESEGEAVKRGYVTWDVLKKSFDRLRGQVQGPTCEVAWSLSDLLGLELWLRVFFGKSGDGNEGCTEQSSGLEPEMISGGRR